VAGRVSQVFRGLVKFVQDMVKIWRAEFNFIVDILQVVLPKALQFLQAVWTTVFPFLMGTLNVFRALFENAFNIMSTIIQAVFIPALNILVTVFQQAWALIVNSIEAALQIIKGVFEVLRGIITLDWQTLWQGIQDIMGGALKWAIGFLSVAWELLKSIFTNGIDAVIALMKNLPGAIVRALGNLLTVLLQSGRDVLQGLFDGIIEISLKLLAWFVNLPSEILKKVLKADKWLYDIGKAVIQGLWDGMIAIWNKVSDWISDRASDIAGFFKTALNLGSPSKVMREIGQFTMQGLLQGLEMLRPALEDTVEQLASTLTSLSAAPELTPAFNATSALSGLAGGPTPAAQQIITYEGDDVDVNVRTDADPHEIVETLMFEKKFR
jgi:phage-related protein